MYLSKIDLNPARAAVQRVIADSYLVHKLLYALFDEPNAERILFRVEAPEDSPPSVLFQSRLCAPDFQRLDLKLTDLLAMPQTKPFEPVFAEGQMLSFRLLARPSKRIAAKDDGAMGKRRTLKEDDEKLDWIRRQGDRGGFKVQGCDLSYMSFWDFRPVHKGLTQQPVGPAGATRFDGVLQVADPDAFKKALEAGLGPQKGFGFGLLSLARA
jgi:CRISPR system Cascade subunit CasE